MCLDMETVKELWFQYYVVFDLVVILFKCNYVWDIV